MSRAVGYVPYVVSTKMNSNCRVLASGNKGLRSSRPVRSTFMREHINVAQCTTQDC